jgi:hypothetical protein
MSAKTRQTITSGILAVLGFGAVCFAAFWVFPLLQDVRASYAAVKDEIQTLNKRNESDNIPTKGAINQHVKWKKDLITQAERCASFYLRQNQNLNEKILESWRMDEYEIKMSFNELKQKLAQKAGNPDFLELGEVDDWEQREHGKPHKRNFRKLEKKSAMASILVNILTHDPATVIELMKIGKPVPPSNLPPEPNVNWMFIRYRMFPVTISFSSNFSSLGKTFHKLTTIPRTASNIPCIQVRELSIEKSKTPGKVKVELAINVLDFYEPKKEG